ncbi:glycerophosphodiester phosphodiesterase protein kinase domain-containing gdpdl2 [Phtheirospermum japonicum]|uniref:Glycerophosphodiester phosphodiesterase protein kinase domain-containing gdpdl2 n=1 Tax=Phtheirospermum japonicum TaxID=374723 RepID=A0A830BGS8_9LAMI|nr:glycerophosphodiester phosphodiesterase protein kinase domain-containing gdpdl2 [Phtheirospermum japonicum]
MTKSFSENLGKGGYGSVYKGKLADGRLVAVKILNESKGNGEEFMNEVASISRTSHINVVTLLGFCFEESKRALVYDFMPNGSLEEEGGLGWEKLFEIALCIARGLEYLHEGCNTRILHFDIKPHNILLDKDFNPKISDFGLAKLCPNRSSIVSMLGMRGTMGYIAPEVFCRNFGEVSYKSDVYSYGMIVLEIAGGLGNAGPRKGDRTSDVYFPNYVYKELGMEVGTRLDGTVTGDGSEMAKRKMIIVGLWCIQIDPKDRPSMSKVVEMLEGKIESLQVPPKPYLSSPPRSGPTSSQPSSATYLSSSRSL